MKPVLSFVALFTVMLLMAAGLATAQVPKPDRYGNSFGLDPDGVPYSSKYWYGRPKDNVISLVRKPELTEDQFVLRISDRYAMSGCVDLGDYAYIAEYRDAYLDIHVEGTTVDMRDQPQYAHFECDLHTQTPMADIVLNRQDLIKNGTKQIVLSNLTDSNYFNITLYDNKVTVFPDESNLATTQRFKPHEMAKKKTNLVYWFYPMGTVMLWAQGEEDTPELHKAVRDFALNKGLVPLEDIYESFKSPMTDKKYQYFVDTSGTFTGSNASIKDGTQIGTVTGQKLVYGLEKDDYKPYDIMVYAKTPGMYD